MYEDFTVKEFMDAWWKSDRSVMSEEQFQQVKNEYIDTSGQYDKNEFSKKMYIDYLLNRKNSISIWIEAQLKFLEEFEIPFLPSIDFLKRFGHNIKWEDKNSFIKQLVRVKKREFKYVSILEVTIKELEEIKLKQKKEREKSVQKESSQDEFIAMIISLRKCGYEIKLKETTVQELSHCIKKQIEEYNKSQK